jgi:hypothetical protein
MLSSDAIFKPDTGSETHDMETLQLPTLQGPGVPALVIAPHTAMLGITDATTAYTA